MMYNDYAMTNLVQVKTNAKILVETLSELGTDSIFGYPGASVLSIYNELAQVKNIKHYLVRHEQAAVHAAEGYARVSGKTGVVLVTSGPGFTNTVTGIANAYADSTPLVILAGDVANTNKNGKIFQNVDIASIVKSCCKKIITLSENDDTKSVIKEAFEEANSGVKGPVTVILPRNVLETEYNHGSSKISYQNVTQNLDITNEIIECQRLINSAKHPLILIGGGCLNCAEEIKQFVSALQIPVVSTLMGIGVYPDESSLYLGMIGLNGIEPANEALGNCDLLLALGTSFSDRSTCKKQAFATNCKVISVNLQNIARNFELQIKSDVKEFLKQCLYYKSGFISRNNRLFQTDVSTQESNSDDTSEILHSSYVLKTLSEYTKSLEPVVVTDVGQHQMLTAQFFNFNKPRKFITSGGLGTMGFGLPAAIGAYVANQNNLVLNITGDGSFQMNLQELATCREHNIPVKIIILNNSYLGMVRQLQEKIYNTRYQVEMINPDFTKIAEAYDLYAIRVTTKDELIPALERAINYKGTVLIDVLIDSFENI